MAFYQFGDRVPEAGRGCYVSDSARVIGDVVIGDDCYIGHGAILRGDYGSIRLGPGTAVEENAVIHIRPDGLSVLGERVTIGHGAIIHGDHIDDFAVIGMGAIISMNVIIGRWSIVAEGCVLTQGTEIGPEKFVTGVPGKIAGDIKDRHKDYWTWGKQLYVDLARSYCKKLKRID
ncbi:MAG: gamma carbonic anhydrase family protein [Deltaproteobacteria bacterium]|nr:gamma carbonic anhydrase family protein [Deltaproteobacteria bacterium]